jgi:hypothetical protein
MDYLVVIAYRIGLAGVVFASVGAVDWLLFSYLNPSNIYRNLMG